jgi:sulfonate transport system ATP-binding protein
MSTPPPTSPAVSIRALTRSFHSQKVLDSLDLTIESGELVALLGRSGSGKTTLLRTLGGLDAASAGEIHLPEARAVVFQEPRLLPWKRAWENVALGLSGPGVRARALAALDEVELSHRAEAWPLTLSGGEAQRVALARALLRQPGLLLLDEPFASLDALTRVRMHDLVRKLWRGHQPAILLVTHDVDEAISLANRILVLEKGRIKPALEVPADPPPGWRSKARNDLLRLLGVH